MSTAKGQIGSKEATVYWRHLSGELMMAPDTQLEPFTNWYRIECRNVQETEYYSRKLAMQEFEKFRSLKVQEHMRYKAKRDQIAASCRLRLQKGCISAADEFANRNTLRSQELKDELLYKLLASEPDLSRASLEIEKYDAATIKSRSQGKHQGLRDEEVNSVAQLIAGVR